MEKTAVFLMCENIEKQSVDVDAMVRHSPEKTIRFIHSQYAKAQKELNHIRAQSQSESP